MMRRFENINGEKPVIEIKPHRKEVAGSQQIILTFKNGYGASIIPEYHVPNTGDFEKDWKNQKIVKGHYELAVFHNGELCYETPVTDDVLRMLNDPELQNAVEKIQRLEFMSIHHLHNEETDA